MVTSAAPPANAGTFTLSEAQQAVVDYPGGDLQVIACAGAGKTEAISRRIARLISEGTEPASIVAFTFTERAAAELKERIARRVIEVAGPEAADRIGPMFVGTIHAYCFRLLQDHVPRYGNYDVLDEHRHAGFVSREYRSLGLSKLGSAHWKPVLEWLRTVDVIANELIPPESLAGTDVGEIYGAYRAALDRYHFVTFGLIIACAVEALQDPAVFERVHAPLRYLFVDEYQDVNPAQERLIELLGTGQVQLCVVADDDQAIYQWRGSDVRNVLEFAKRRPTAATLTLAENRRSRPKIVAAANVFAQTIPDRLVKSMQPLRPDDGPELVGWRAPSADDEAEEIADTIERLHDAGHRWRDIAILFRSVRTSAPAVIAAFEQRGIPFACGGRTGLFMQPEISLLGELFAWLADSEWKDSKYAERRTADLDRVVAGFEHHLGNDQPMPGLKKFFEDWKTWQLRGASSVNLVEDLYKILNRLGVQTLDPDNATDAARLGAYARFSQVLADFEHVTRRGRWVQEDGVRTFRGGRDRGKPYFQALASYLLHYALDAYEDWSGEERDTDDAVQILTVHQAKGLEWPVVFIPALVKGRFPARRAGSRQTWLLDESAFPAPARRRYEGGDSEERRLFYVALTRARDCVYLSCFERHATNSASPTPYLIEICGKVPDDLNPLPLPASFQQAAADTSPLDISFSDVALWDDCGYRYRLGAVFGFNQKLAPELGYGRAIHHVLRQVAETARTSSRVPNPDELESLLDSEFYLPFANAPAFSRMRAAARRLVGRYMSDYSDDLHRVWAVEHPFELQVPGGRVSGRADVILNGEGGEHDALAIVDYKVASDPEYDARYRRQLAVYAAAGHREGMDVRAAYLHDLQDGARSSVSVDSCARRDALVALRLAVTEIAARTYTAKPAKRTCDRCDYRLVCGHAART